MTGPQKVLYENGHMHIMHANLNIINIARHSGIQTKDSVVKGPSMSMPPSVEKNSVAQTKCLVTE